MQEAQDNQDHEEQPGSEDPLVHQAREVCLVRADPLGSLAPADPQEPPGSAEDPVNPVIKDPEAQQDSLDQQVSFVHTAVQKKPQGLCSLDEHRSDHSF